MAPRGTTKRESVFKYSEHSVVVGPDCDFCRSSHSLSEPFKKQHHHDSLFLIEAIAFLKYAFIVV